MKEVTDSLDLIKIKNFCSVKCNVKKMKRYDIDWEKIFGKDTSQKKKRHIS